MWKVYDPRGHAIDVKQILKKFEVVDRKTAYTFYAIWKGILKMSGRVSKAFLIQNKPGF